MSKTSRSVNWWGIGVMAGLMALAGCQKAEKTGVSSNSATNQTVSAKQADPGPKAGGDSMALTLESSAFDSNQAIPKAYSGEGKDISPPLSWSGIPEGTKELALICDDPDAPTEEPFVHWALYKIPAETAKLPEGLPNQASLQTPQGARQGRNTFGNIGYGGPAPPKGHGLHHYHFKLYALDSELDLEAGATKKALLDAMQGHIIAQAELVGTYER